MCDLVIIDIVHQFNVRPYKPENQTPIGVHLYRPKTIQLAIEAVKPPTWDTKISGTLSLTKKGQAKA